MMLRLGPRSASTSHRLPPSKESKSLLLWKPPAARTATFVPMVPPFRSHAQSVPTRIRASVCGPVWRIAFRAIQATTAPSAALRHRSVRRAPSLLHLASVRASSAQQAPTKRSVASSCAKAAPLAPSAPPARVCRWHASRALPSLTRMLQAPPLAMTVLLASGALEASKSRALRIRTTTR